MAVSSQLAALLLAAAQPVPPADAPAAAAGPAALLEIFESVCVAGGKAPASFETAAWSDFPEALRLMNTYNHPGTFLRRTDPVPIYFARTEGGAHMGPGLETRCGVAAQGLDAAPIVDRLARVAKADKRSEIGAPGMTTTMLFGKGGAFTVTRAEDDWLIVRSMGFLIPADMVGGRKRKGKRD